MSSARKGQKYVTNGSITKCFNADIAEKFLIDNPDWKYGRTRKKK